VVPATPAGSALDSAFALVANASLALVEFAKFGFDSADAIGHADPTLVGPVENFEIP
jgi:hypothetical protein